ncbi:unnamed protein product [Ectocarpus sp. 6 AP-2014]
MGGGGGGMEQSALLLGSPPLSWPQQQQHQQPALDPLRTEQQLLADSPVLAGVPVLGLDQGQHLDGIGQSRDGGYGGSFSTGMTATFGGMDILSADGMTTLGGVGSDGGVSVPPQQVLVGRMGQGEAAGSRQPQPPQPPQPQATTLFFQQQHLQHLDNFLTDAQQQQQQQQPRLATQVSTPESRNMSVTVPFDGSIDGSEGGGGSGGGGGGDGREAGSFGRVATL